MRVEESRLEDLTHVCYFGADVIYTVRGADDRIILISPPVVT